MRLGTLTAGALASVDDDGSVCAPDLVVRWRVRPGDVWLVPGVDVPARHARPDPAPVAETAVRIPNGDARARAYTVDGAGGAVVVEVENASPSAIAVAFGIEASGRWVASSSRPPSANEDEALVFPVPHRTSVRVVFAREAVDARAVPDAATVARGWDRVLDRGMRVELPTALQQEVDAARADLLLAPVSASTFAALEAWGFDGEATVMWARLGWRDRRAARRAEGHGLLGEIRADVVAERGRVIDAFPGFRSAWLGASLAVHDAPLLSGHASFAVRWHGTRPALLWDVPAGATLRAPVLDPTFAATTRQGETLLREPPVALLPMGEHAPVGGSALEPPEEFS